MRLKVEMPAKIMRKSNEPRSKWDVSDGLWEDTITVALECVGENEVSVSLRHPDIGYITFACQAAELLRAVRMLVE